MKRFSTCFFFLLAIIFSFYIVTDFETSKTAVLRGLLICSKIIIPSLFPFTVCLIFIINTNILSKSKILKFFGKLLSLTAEEMSIFLLSLFSGYPTGAKLLNELYVKGSISNNKAKLLINCCVNAGPAFIISAVGQGVFNSKTIGIVLFISHILASFLLLIFSRNKLRLFHLKGSSTSSSLLLTDNFVLSTASAATSVMNICFYVIFFSVVSAYFERLSKIIPTAKTIVYFLEVTNGVTKAENIYIISFLLGFAGFSIWFQVFSCAKDIKPNMSKFSLYRIIHGTVSCFFTFSIIKIFKIKISTFSNISNLSLNFTHSSIGMVIALVILCVFFIFCVENKKRSGNLVEDLL